MTTDHKWAQWAEIKANHLDPQSHTEQALLAYNIFGVLKDGIDNSDRDMVDIAIEMVASYKRRRPLTYNQLREKARYAVQLRTQEAEEGQGEGQGEG